MAIYYRSNGPYCICVYSNFTHYILHILAAFGQESVLKATIKKNSLPSKSLSDKEEYKQWKISKQTKKINQVIAGSENCNAVKRVNWGNHVKD